MCLVTIQCSATIIAETSIVESSSSDKELEEESEEPEFSEEEEDPNSLDDDCLDDVEPGIEAEVDKMTKTNADRRDAESKVHTIR